MSIAYKNSQEDNATNNLAELCHDGRKSLKYISKKYGEAVD
jgi:hypothetical protein